MNHRDSCCGLLFRWSARSRSGSQNDRRAEGGHWSLGTSSSSSSRLTSRAGPISELAAEAGASNAARIGRDGRVELGLLDDHPVGLLARDRPARRGLAGRAAELDLQPPAAVVGSRLAPELDRADLGHPRRQAHGHALGLRLAAHPHQALERRQLANRVGIGAHEVARLVVGPDRAAGQREDDRLAHQEVEVVAVDRDLVAFLGVAGHDAHPGLGRLLRLEPDVERTRRAAADPDPAAPADDPVVRRPLGHGQVERGVGQDARSIGRARVVGEPRADHLDDPVAHALRRERTAVEQDRVGPRGAVVGLMPPLPDRLGPVPPQEGADVLGHGRVGHERQAELLQPAPGAALRAPRRAAPWGRTRRARSACDLLRA